LNRSVYVPYQLPDIVTNQRSDSSRRGPGSGPRWIAGLVDRRVEPASGPQSGPRVDLVDLMDQRPRVDETSPALRCSAQTVPPTSGPADCPSVAVFQPPPAFCILPVSYGRDSLSMRIDPTTVRMRRRMKPARPAEHRSRSCCKVSASGKTFAAAQLQPRSTSAKMQGTVSVSVSGTDPTR
jgi:hypothetical protein